MLSPFFADWNLSIWTAAGRGTHRGGLGRDRPIGRVGRAVVVLADDRRVLCRADEHAERAPRPALGHARAVEAIRQTDRVRVSQPRTDSGRSVGEHEVTRRAGLEPEVAVRTLDRRT